ncbi:11738_t:CDS:2 [Acaulospora colombiana]|uniref:11738_t:CDS:1 n=1 Tax=Acaulospora colombiana TaxID=27376 RepID=A0ACA9KWA7_9GLOM|nr:11738_t:CDS:2 [Acaulospora colombiana]
MGEHKPDASERKDYLMDLDGMEVNSKANPSALYESRMRIDRNESMPIKIERRYVKPISEGSATNKHPEVPSPHIASRTNSLGLAQATSAALAVALMRTSLEISLNVKNVEGID